MRNMTAHYSKDNIYSTNARGYKKNLVPKVKKSNCDVGILENSNSKYNIDNGCSNHMNKEIFFYILFHSYDDRSFFLLW